MNERGIESVCVQRIDRAARQRPCNAALIEPNQPGTVSGAIAAAQACRDAGWPCVVSRRSGETGDAFIAGFAVATGAPLLEAGPACRGERVAKVNRLPCIEQQLGARAAYAGMAD